MKQLMGQSDNSLGSALHLGGAGLLALLLGVYYFVVYHHFLDQAVEGEERIELLTQELRDSHRVRADHYRLEQTYESLQSQVETIGQRLEQPLEKEQLSQSLRTAALAANLSIDKLTIGKNHQTSSHRRLELELQCSGSYASICNFVDDLGKLTWITDITQLRIQSRDQQTKYSVLAKFSVYYDRTSRESDKS